MNGLNLQEKEILKELASGKTSRQISKDLELTRYYTEKLIQSAMDKLAASTRSEAVAKAVSLGLVTV
jgi:DNA-binding CsgD family transcriptional regulator